jgi:ADP-ribose pyrophosphatase
MPTGGVKSGESLLEAAHRELREEIGYDAAQLNQINTYDPRKSVMHEIAHLYVGNQLTRIQVIPDETEFLEIEIFPFDQVLQMTLKSEIRDSMTVLAVLYAARLLGM